MRKALGMASSVQRVLQRLVLEKRRAQERREQQAYH
jgi:hypothetical protein